MSKFIKVFDIFGTSFSPTIGNSSKQQTTIGGIFGLLFFGFGVYIVYIFGSVLIYFDIPYQTEQIHVDSNNNFNLSMTIGYSYTFSPIKNDMRSDEQTAKDLAFLNNFNNLDRFISNINMYVNASNEHLPVPVKNCSYEQFGDNLDDVDKSWVDKSLCFDTHNSTLNTYNKIEDPRARFPAVTFQSCENNTKFRKYANDCISTEQQNYYLTNYEIRTYFIYSGLAYNLSNPYNPLSLYLDIFYSKFIINPQADITKVANFVELNRFIVNTDIGYFTNNTLQSEGQQINSISYLVGGSPYARGYIDNYWRKVYTEVIFYCSKSNIVMNRSYPKVQDVIANAGGILGLIAFLVQNFLQVIYDSKAKELIIHQIFYLDYEDENSGAPCDKEFNKCNLGLNGKRESVEIDKNIDNSRINIVNGEKANSSNEMVPISSCKKLELSMHKKKTCLLKRPNPNSPVEKKISTARENLLESKGKNIPKTKYAPFVEEKVPLNMFDHFILSYLCCCACGRLKKIATHYKEVEEIVSSYTDILNMVQTSFEMEKMKYLLMDEDQVAIFNLRSKVSFERDSPNSSEFSKFYYFSKDLNDNIKTDQIQQELLERPNQQRFNARLVDLDKS